MKHTDEAVIGYAPQPQYKIDLVNQNKVLEAYVLDQIAKLTDHARISPKDVDARSVALAKTKIEEAFMWLNRAIFQPTQVRAPVPNAVDPKQGTPVPSDMGPGTFVGTTAAEPPMGSISSLGHKDVA
jgi:hypothetical protein